MTQQFRVIVSRRAASDMDRLESWLLDKDPGAAAAVGELLREAVNLLRDFPERGRSADRGLRILVRPFGKPAYQLRYLVRDRLVVVVAVQHSRESG